MADEGKCVICEADFRPEALVTSVGGTKKCKVCEASYPHAFTREEVKVKTKNKAQTLDEARVHEIVYEKLEEANIVRHRCEKCGKMFFRHATMQKMCHECVKKTADKADAEGRNDGGGK